MKNSTRPISISRTRRSSRRVEFERLHQSAVISVVIEIAKPFDENRLTGRFADLERHIAVGE